MLIQQVLLLRTLHRKQETIIRANSTKIQQSPYNINSNPSRMRPELRRVHALDFGDAVAEVTGLRGEEGVFEDVFALRHPVNEEVRGGVLRGFVVP